MSARARRAGTATEDKSFSFEKLLHLVASRNHILLVGTLDGDLEVAPVRVEAVRQHRRIARGFLALDENLVDLVGLRLRHGVLHAHEVIQLDRAVLLSPALAGRFGIRDYRLQLRVGRYGAEARRVELAGEQHGIDLLPCGRALYVRWIAEFGDVRLLVRDPLDLREIDAVVLGQDAANPGAGGHRV